MNEFSLLIFPLHIFLWGREGVVKTHAAQHRLHCCIYHFGSTEIISIYWFSFGSS